MIRTIAGMFCGLLLVPFATEALPSQNTARDLASGPVFASGCGHLKRTSGEHTGPVPIETEVVADQSFFNLRKEAMERVQKGELPSVSVGVIRDGSVIWEESLGWADKDGRLPATPCTAYGLASLGKSLVGTAIMVLVDRGLVDLNAPIARYLNGARLQVFAGKEDDVTVRRVLNMTAAIPHGGEFFFSEAALSEQSTDDLVRNRGIVVFPPGEVYLYSNFAYAVLEDVIEKVSGKSYPQFLEREIFKPLGMTNSFVSPRTKGAGAMVTLYNRNGSPMRPGFSLPRSSLATFSSVNDLLNFARFHLEGAKSKGGQIFSDKSLEIMHELRGEAPHSRLALGIGSVELDDGSLLLLTDGQAGGMQSTLVMIPSQNVAVVCLINATGQSADEFAFRILDSMVPGFLKQIHKRIEAASLAEQEPYKITPQLLGEWSGTVTMSRAKVPVKLVFQPDGDVHIRIGEQPETILSDVEYRDGLLSGDFISNLEMEERFGHPHAITLSLRVKDGTLSGFVTSNFTSERGTFSLPAYVLFTKTGE